MYQENVWDDSKTFVSFKKVVRDMGSACELVSVHSVSKGFLGECGRRGGYAEMVNIDASVKEQLYKYVFVVSRLALLCSALLCSALLCSARD